ncbi:MULTISPECIES: RluA family pseudouridine synthase [Chitinophagaceae]
MKTAFDIILADEHIIAVNKPAGMLSIPDRANTQPSLKAALQQQYGDIFVVHRIDRPTSGLIIFARNAEVHKALSALFLSREMSKKYIAIINGTLYPENGTIDAPIAEHPAKNGTMVVHSKGKASVTDYKTIEKFPLFSLVEYRIHTGRTHQIRVHTKHLGHSIVGDEVYGDGKPVLVSQIRKDFKLSKTSDEEQPILARLALHSYQMDFTLMGKAYHLEAPLWKDMRATLQQLRKQ